MPDYVPGLGPVGPAANAGTYEVSLASRQAERQELIAQLQSKREAGGLPADEDRLTNLVQQLMAEQAQLRAQLAEQQKLVQTLQAGAQRKQQPAVRAKSQPTGPGTRPPLPGKGARGSKPGATSKPDAKKGSAASNKQQGRARPATQGPPAPAAPPKQAPVVNFNQNNPPSSWAGQPHNFQTVHEAASSSAYLSGTLDGASDFIYTGSDQEVYGREELERLMMAHSSRSPQNDDGMGLYQQPQQYQQQPPIMEAPSALYPGANGVGTALNKAGAGRGRGRPRVVDMWGGE